MYNDGILDQKRLPDKSFDNLWDAVIVDQSLKDSLLGQAVINFTVRPKLDRSGIPMHGVILLVGPPGTGKTSLARGLASRTAASLKSIGSFTYLEVEPHELTSSALGKSQQAVRHLLGKVVAEIALAGPLIVLLDEVETLAANRTKMSLEANPVDVHRATDAVLAQLDYLAANNQNILFIATSNFKEAIDSAFMSRCDLVATVGLPNENACKQILVDAVSKLAIAFPQIGHLVQHHDLYKAAQMCVGMDGRRIRKMVMTALALDKNVAVTPEKLRIEHILEAAKKIKAECSGEL